MHTDCYLDWNSNHLISAKKKAVIQALIYRAKMFVPLLKYWLTKWTTSPDFFLKNNCPDWFIKDLEKKSTTLTVNPDICLKVNKNIFIPVPYVPGLSENFRRIF